MTSTCIILAGGLGSRLGDLTKELPKALIEIAGYPFVQYQLQLLKNQGFNRIVFSIGHLGSMIVEEIRTNPPVDLGVEFVSDGDRLLGTGGAVRQILAETVTDEFVFVTYGDSYLDFDPKDLKTSFRGDRFDAVMSVYPNHDLLDKNNVRMDSDESIFYAKSSDNSQLGLNMVDFGMSYIRRATVLEKIPTNRTYDLASYFEELSGINRLQGMVVENRFYEIGSIQGRDEFEKFVKRMPRK